MRVPDKISVAPENLNGHYDQQRDRQPSAKIGGLDWMHVPDKILVAGGGDQTLSDFDNLSDFEQGSQNHNKSYLDHNNSPKIAFLAEQRSPADDSFLPTDAFNNTNFSVSGGGSDDMSLMKRQVKSLSRRVTALERDNQQRYQRDVVLYALGVVYFVMKGISWLNRRW